MLRSSEWGGVTFTFLLLLLVLLGQQPRLVLPWGRPARGKSTEQPRRVESRGSSSYLLLWKHLGASTRQRCSRWSGWRLPWPDRPVRTSQSPPPTCSRGTPSIWCEGTQPWWQPGSQMMTSPKPKLTELLDWIDSHLVYCFSLIRNKYFHTTMITTDWHIQLCS